MDESPRQVLPIPAAVICDLDGTLVDTVPTRIAAWSAVFAEVGIPADEAHLGSLIGSDGRWLTEQVAAGAGRSVGPAEAEDIDRRAGEIYEALNREPRPLPGVSAFLAALEQRRVPWAIATSSRPAQVQASVAALGLDRAPLIVDGASVSRAKPAPDILLAAAERLGYEPAACWCVGDSVWDVRAAIAAGMPAAAVTAGSATSGSQLKAAGAAAVVARLDGLVPALDGRA